MSDGAERPVVMLTRRIGVPPADDELDRAATVVVAESAAAEHLTAAVADAEGMIAIRPATITRDVIAAAPKLRVISAMGSGSDHVDVDAATEHGVVVTSGAGIAATAVAEFALGAMVAGHRELAAMHRRLVAGDPWGDIKRTVGLGLDGSTVGVIGFGRIGRLVATRVVAGFGAEAIVFDPFVDAPTDLPTGVRFTTDLGELLERSTTVSVHVPLTPETTGLLGSDELAALGSDGLLVQASRGGVVDEAALLAALQQGTIKGAVIDVFEAEPPPTEQIAALAATGRALLTPHMASFTRQGMVGLATAAVRDVLDLLAAPASSALDLPSNVVNRAGLIARAQLPATASSLNGGGA